MLEVWLEKTKTIEEAAQQENESKEKSLIPSNGIEGTLQYSLLKEEENEKLVGEVNQGK